MNAHLRNPCLVFDFIDSPNDPHSHSLVFSNPVQVIVANSLDEVVPALNDIQRAVETGLYAAGFISYEAAPAFDSAFEVSPRHTRPLLWFGLFHEPTIGIEDSDTKGDTSFSEWRPSITRSNYEKNVHQVREAIARGETYQVNYTFRLQSQFSGDEFAFYQSCRSTQQQPYSAYLNLGQFQILSFSPELFFRVSGRRIMTSPMKGTVKRGRWFEEDEANALWLSTSEKNKAENVMIVDLLRNDLGRIAEVGSIEVPHLFDIERYPTVFQMTSTVEATLRPEVTLADIFNSLFPCGSITGAPKIRTMHLISQLEDSPREVYCGTIGYVKPGGDALFNVAIRTMVVDSETGMATYGTGGGITWDSAADIEYAEAESKAALLTHDNPPFELLETINWDRNRFILLDRHLQRLVRSAKYFNIPLNLEDIKTALEKHSQSYPDEARRVRLLVSQESRVYIESSALMAHSQESMAITIANSPISADYLFLFHKTTHRLVYQAHHNQQSDIFDTLLWNEQGFITEFTNGNVVLEIDGQKLTPALECGLLPGTLRAQLLEDGEIQESFLSLSDLHRANNLWFINSVRGWVPVHVVRPTDG